MSLLHYCMVDSSYATMPYGFARNASGRASFTTLAGYQQPSLQQASNNHMTHSTGSISSGGGGGGMSLNVTSMMGSAISVIPGTGLINNLIGKVFTSGDSSSQPKPDLSADPSVALAQKELLKLLPSILAILCDVWTVTLQAAGLSAEGSAARQQVSGVAGGSVEVGWGVLKI